MRNMKQWICKTAALLLAAVFLLPVKVQALSARRAVVVDGVTGRQLYGLRETEQALIASTTKIMTALVVCEQCNVLDTFCVPRQAVGIEGSSMYLQEGERLSIQELLYGLMLSSGNDAAVALAIYCGGSVESFVALMNDKARALGLTHTHFANPNGLDDPQHYSSAQDLAALAVYAMKNPIFSKTVSTKTVSAGQRYLTNHNKLLWRLAGADGVKTGYTKAAGRTLVSSAVRDGRRLIAVTLDAPNDWQDHGVLLENGFSKYHLQTIVKKEDPIVTIPVLGGSGNVTLHSDADFSYPLSSEDVPQVQLSGMGFAYAPVVKGAQAGTAYVLLEGKVIGKIPLVYGQTVEQTPQSKRFYWQEYKSPRSP